MQEKSIKALIAMAKGAGLGLRLASKCPKCRQDGFYLFEPGIRAIFEHLHESPGCIVSFPNEEVFLKHLLARRRKILFGIFRVSVRR